MGDDTWMSVFPNVFHPNMTFPYDSFNVEDLHSVDQGVITHLFPLLENPSKPFDFLIGHFLGVDHVGHRVGPDHPSMKAKLQQMNTVLQRVVDKLDDETLLVVLGDHGMDRSGDHGGDGVLETSAALWIYSKGPALTSTSAPPSGLLKYKTFPGSAARHRSIQQIDILPTMSLLLGLPIPFSNLGSLIPEIFWRTGNGVDLKRALELNVDQVRTYLDTYRSSPSGGELDDSWDHIQRTWDAIQSVSHLNLKDAPLVALNNFNRATLGACRSMWAQFNPILMGFGLAVLCIGTFSSWLVYAALSKARNDWHSWLKVHIPRCIQCAIVGAALGLVAHYAISAHAPGIRASDWILCFASLSSCLAFIVTCPFPLVTLRSFPVILALHTTAFFSNSFTFWEDRIVLFLIVTCVLVNFIPYGITAPTSHLRRRILGFSSLLLVCIRLISISTICREEQQPYCHITFFASSSLPSPPTLVLILAMPMASIIIPLAIQRILRITKSDVGIASTFLPVIIRPSLIAGALFWFAEWADSTHVLAAGNESFWTAMLRGIRSWLARFAFGWPLLAGFGIWWLIPICLQIQVNDGTETDSFTARPEGEGQPRLGPGPKRQVTVLGFANAFGSPYLLFWTVFFCVVYASLQLTAQFVLGLATVALLAYLEIVDSVRDARSIDVAFAAGTPSSILNTSPMTNSTSPETGAAVRTATQLRFSDVVPILLLGQLTFYATGHQATVSSIQWKAAFLLTETVKYPWSPFTVACNFLGPVAIFAGLGVPLVAIWNRAPGMSIEDPHSRSQGQKEAGQSALLLERERYDAQVKADSTLAALGAMIYFGMLLLGTAMSAAILRRHLMVWKVFAPRFMAAAVHLAVVDLSVLVGVGVGLTRIARKIGVVFGCW